MENEDLELDLDKIEGQVENNLKVKNRFEKLSEKVIVTAKEKEEAEGRAKASAEAQAKAEKERDFFKDFSQVSSKYPQATQHQDKILERVNRGYSAKDATLAVLDEVGQLQPITAGTTSPNIAGGSASTAMSDSGDKRPEDMTRDEMRNQLLQAEKEGVNLLKMQ